MAQSRAFIAATSAAFPDRFFPKSITAPAGTSLSRRASEAETAGERLESASTPAIITCAASCESDKVSENTPGIGIISSEKHKRARTMARFREFSCFSWQFLFENLTFFPVPED
jgi:hypothetical protein